MLNWWQVIQPQALAFSFGPFSIQWYGIIVTTAIVVAYFLARNFYRQDGGDDKTFENTFFWTIIFGLVGARIFHVFVFQWSYYSQHVDEIWRIWQGGIAIQGGVTFGLLTLWYLSRKYKFNIWRMTDYFVPGLALGQALGRWGNFFNQELYGKPDVVPWSIFIDKAHRLPEFAGLGLYHPVFLYESILNLLLFALLIGFRKSLRLGQLTAVYLVGYGFIRFFTAFYKIDPHPELAGLRLSQYIAMVFVVVGVCLWLYSSGRSLPKKNKPLPES